ncbi:MAG: acetylxylan esterase, partial [Thermoguttaceae bacterium]|nr:acetylxylan esterase [Thermoguttaceae bacterium]
MFTPNRITASPIRVPRLLAAGALLLFALLPAALRAGEISFYGETEKNPLAYEPGEEIVFNVQLLDDGAPCGGKTVRWLRTGDDGKTEEGEAVTDADRPLAIRTSIETPGFVWLKVVALDEAGNNIPGENHEFNGGAGVLLDRLGSAPEPDDFDAFWQRQKERLAEVPLEAHLTEVDSPDENVKCYD